MEASAESVIAGLISWEDVRTFSGWAGLLSLLVVLALTEHMRRTFATKDELANECEDRGTADEHRDQEMHRVAEMVQQFVGKVEIMERRQETADREREREVAALREEVRTGFARLEAALERHGKRNKGE